MMQSEIGARLPEITDFSRFNLQVDRDAPVYAEDEIHIKADPQKVWDLLVDFQKWPLWNEKVSSVSIKSALVPGMKFTWKSNGITIRSTLHTVQPVSLLGWEGKAVGSYAIHNWVLTPIFGGCMLSVKESMTGWIVRLFNAKMRKTLQADMKFWLEKIKSECEGR